ncbi:MAG: hypothetical protein ACOZNI_10005 [Myxococcota bacterium]
MIALVLAALADTGDTADTGAYLDDEARAEKVYEQKQVGCGEGGAAALLLAFIPLWRSAARGGRR